MALFSRSGFFQRRLASIWRGKRTPQAKSAYRRCRYEQMEPRRMLASDIQVGAVYYEEASGEDQGGDVIHVSFEGGQPGTQLTQLRIETDKLGDGLTIGDAFFDTSAGGAGAYGSQGFQIVSANGIDSVDVQVVDGGTALLLTFEGFDAGETFAFSIDVDEQGFLGSNAVAEGNEFEGSQLHATFTAPHYFDATGTDIFLDQYDANFAGTGLTLPADGYVPPGSTPHPVRTAGATFSLTQTPLPITLSGTVYEDIDLDNTQDPGDDGIAGVELSLWRKEGASYVDTGLTTTTDSSGNYQFDGLLPGTYRVVEAQPTGYFSVGASAGNVDGVTNGLVTSENVLSEITLLGGDDSVDNDYAESLPVSISGRVHADEDGDCELDPGEVPLAGVTIQLLDAQGNVIDTTLTDANGEYTFDGLRAGVYGVHEVQPTGYIDSGDHVGSSGGTVSANDTITQVGLESGEDAINYNFCEIPPGSISGRVHADLDGDCELDPGELPLQGVTIRLFDADGNLVDTTTTDANGEYTFDDLAPGVYTVVEEQPAGYLDSGDHPGSAGGVVSSNDTISEIALGAGVDAVDYNFCEIPPSTLSGRVHADLDGDSQYDPGELLLEGVTINLYDEQGNLVASTTTDVNGEYQFTNLAPGLYSVEEIQPAGYLDSEDHAGTAGGLPDGVDSILFIDLPAGFDAEHYDFCEVLPASLSGRVHADVDGDCELDPGELPLEGVTIRLYDDQGNLVATTTTDVNGEYTFGDLRPGVYKVVEEQPAGYFDSGDHPGSAGGIVTENDTIEFIDLGSGVNATDYNFCEKPPASLAGRVHADTDGDCELDPGELLLEGVTIRLYDEEGNLVDTTTTDVNGEYKFDNLAPGVYTVIEEQPAGYFDGGDDVGSAGGVELGNDTIGFIDLGPGVDAVDYNFCEKPPASISGYVYEDNDNDGVKDAGEDGIGGVTVSLLDSAGNPTGATTVTDADGFYQFTGLAQGQYGVAEGQPIGYLDGTDAAGSAGGSAVNPGDRIAGATLTPGLAAINYNFGELQPATISGFVFQDGPAIEITDGTDPDAVDVYGLRNGIRTPDDTPLAGVVLVLGDAGGEPILDQFGDPVTAVTDADGYYEFTGLAPGTYTVFQVQPGSFRDGNDTPGTTGGLAANPGGPLHPQFLSLNHKFDAIIFVAVGAGQTSQQNNFSEVALVELPPPPEFPPENPPRNPLPPPVGPGAPPIAPAVYGPIGGPGNSSVFYGGSGYAATGGYSWHLSVIDAGSPRGDGNAVATLVRVSESRRDVFLRASSELTETPWRLGEGDDAREIVFGNRDATPITGDFNGDGTTDVGVFVDGQWFIDVNGNGVWDLDDLWAEMGRHGDRPVTGDWDGDGKTDIGIFGPAWPGDARAIDAEPGLPDPENEPTGAHKNIPPTPERATSGWRTMQKTAQGQTRSDLIDHVFYFGGANDVPVTGDFNGDGVDTIGVFNNGTWLLDSNGDGRWLPGEPLVEMGQVGDLPVVGDFDGDGVDDLGVYREGRWHIDTNHDALLDARDKVFELGGAGDVPVVGDWNSDGVDEPGLYQAGRIVPAGG